MQYLWLLFALVTFSLSAQTLQVRVLPEEIYAGDAFQLEASINGEEITEVTYTASSPTQLIGRSSKVSSINGHFTSSKILQILPKEVGICRIDSVQAKTKQGKTIVYNKPLEVQVQALLPDADVKLFVETTPENPLPGDTVTLFINVQVPALPNNDTWLSPFLTTDFFGRIQERLPNILFDAETGEDAPLRLVTAPKLIARNCTANLMTWKFQIEYQAIRVGEQTFPSAILNDTRYLLNPKNQQLIEKRCCAIGQPSTIRVSAPPEEGRPEGFYGAVATTFSVSAELDALNVNVGDPLKLTITFTTDAANELIRAPQLPSLKGFRIYGDPIRDTFEGGCSFTYNLRPTQEGLLEIPSFAFSWFDRAARLYHTVHTIAVPLYARASAQLLLLGDDGEQLNGIMPPALRFEEGEKPIHVPTNFALTILIFGTTIALIRLCKKPIIWSFSGLKRLFIRNATTRTYNAIRMAKTPEEVLATLRLWLKTPSLTATNLRDKLPQTPEALQLTTAVTALECAVYSQSDDFDSARECILKLLPKVAKQMKGHIHSSALKLLILLLLAPGMLIGAPDTFLREQAEAVSTNALTPQDYARAANLWCMVASDTKDAFALLNAASCALLARHPVAAESLIQHYECLYGINDDSRLLTQAIADRTGQTRTWNHAITSLLYQFSYAQRLDFLCIVGGIFLFLCGIPWKKLCALRVITGMLLLIISICVVISFLQYTHWEMIEPLPEVAEIGE